MTLSRSGLVYKKAFLRLFLFSLAHICVSCTSSSYASLIYSPHHDKLKKLDLYVPCVKKDHAGVFRSALIEALYTSSKFCYHMHPSTRYQLEIEILSIQDEGLDYYYDGEKGYEIGGKKKVQAKVSFIDSFEKKSVGQSFFVHIGDGYAVEDRNSSFITTNWVDRYISREEEVVKNNLDKAKLKSIHSLASNFAKQVIQQLDKVDIDKNR